MVVQRNYYFNSFRYYYEPPIMKPVSANHLVTQYITHYLNPIAKPFFDAQRFRLSASKEVSMLFNQIYGKENI